MSPPIPAELKRVQTALERHRRQSGRQRIPDRIRRQTVDLLSVYPRKQIINTLGISYKMLRNWLQESVATEEAADSAPVHFVSLPAIAESVTDSAPPLSTLELRFSDEVILAFHGAGATTHCLQLLQGLGYGREITRVYQGGRHDSSDA